MIWAGFIVSARAGSRTGLPPWDMGLLRFAGAFLGGLPLLAAGGWPRLRWREFAAIVLPACFGFPLLAYAGFQFAPASHGGVMMPGMLPFVSALVMRVALGDRFTPRRIAGLALTAAGIALLAWDTFAAVPGAWRGDLLMLSAVSAYSFYMLAVRVWRIDARNATLAMCLYALPLFLPVWLLLPTRLGEVGWPVIAVQMFMQGIAAVLIANYLFTRALLALGPATLTAVAALVPGLAALGAWVLMDEPVEPIGIAGIALVACATVLGVWTRR